MNLGLDFYQQQNRMQAWIGVIILAESLYFAAGNGHNEIIRLLLDNGGDPTNTYNGATPLHNAAGKWSYRGC